MQPSKIKIFIGVFSLISLSVILFLLYPFSSHDGITAYQLRIFIALSILLNLLVILVWLGLGRLAGSIVSVLLLAIVNRFFPVSPLAVRLAYIISLFVSTAIGYKFRREFFICDQTYTVRREKIEEDINILRDELKQNEHEVLHLDRRFSRYTNLSEITERFNSTLTEKDVIKIISDQTYKLFGGSDRALFFRVDTAKQELRLVYSRKRQDLSYIRLKKGDIFDTWVFRKKQPLLVENIHTDYRFSTQDEEIDKYFSSLIAAPLVSGNNVLGLLRLDNRKPFFYKQDDLRLLDIISDLASVTLENAILYKRLSDLAITDGLTSLYVQKYFKERLAREIKSSAKTKSPFSLMLLDVDKFKEYNDKYGHMLGDLVLKHIALILRNNLDPGDMAARYGGEEFAILLLRKDLTEAARYAEKLRKKIENTPIVLRRKRTYMTISVGVACYPKDSKSGEGLLRCSDDRLYKAKDKGRNRVCKS